MLQAQLLAQWPRATGSPQSLFGPSSVAIRRRRPHATVLAAAEVRRLVVGGFYGAVALTAPWGRDLGVCRRWARACVEHCFLRRRCSELLLTQAEAPPQPGGSAAEQHPSAGGLRAYFKAVAGPPAPGAAAPVVPLQFLPDYYDAEGRLQLKNLTLEELEGWCESIGGWCKKEPTHFLQPTTHLLPAHHSKGALHSVAAGCWGAEA